MTYAMQAESEMWDTIATSDRPAPAAKPTPQAVLKDELYPTKWRKDYVARLVGSHAKYRVHREFCDRGKRDGTYGAIVRERGVYEARIENVKRWELFDGHRWIGIPELPELAKRIRPGVLENLIGTLERRTVDVWDSLCVLCDAEVEAFTADGWPTCDQHADDIGQPDYATTVQVDTSMEVPF